MKSSAHLIPRKKYDLGLYYQFLVLKNLSFETRILSAWNLLARLLPSVKVDNCSSDLLMGDRFVLFSAGLLLIFVPKTASLGLSYRMDPRTPCSYRFIVDINYYKRVQCVISSQSEMSTLGMSCALNILRNALMVRLRICCNDLRCSYWDVDSERSFVFYTKYKCWTSICLNGPTSE